MKILNMLVAFNGANASIAALRYAAAIARITGGHVTAALAHAAHESYDSQGSFVTREVREIIARSHADVLDQIEARFDRERASLGLGDRLHFTRISGRVDRVLSAAARTYDMIFVGQFGADDTDEHVTVHPDRIALMSGRPVMVIPEGHTAEPTFDHAVLAWDGGRASARALSDSMRLLKGHGRVSVVTVGMAELTRPVDELMLHLERHGLNAEHHDLALKQSVGESILAYCADSGPCMLVMGAYEHSKFREDFLGGVTATVLRNSAVPVLLSH